MLLNAVYKKQLVHRYDDEGYITYFTAADFPGLQAEPFAFGSGQNTLRGFFYRRGGEKSALIVFCHGIGGGHRSYMAEIDALCRRGYTVLAYDNTGCFASDGADIGGFTQAPKDLLAAVEALRAQGAPEKYAHVYVMGHSWGGYAAGVIPLYTDMFEKAAVISGFVSVSRMLQGQLAKVSEPIKRVLLRSFAAIETKNAPHFFAASSLDALNAGKTKYLFAHSKDDAMVPFREHTQYIMENAAAPAVYKITEGRGHNPNYTADAVSYMTRVFGGFQKAQKEGKLKTLAEKQSYFAGTDWRRMTAQDEAFWDEIAAFLDE